MGRPGAGGGQCEQNHIAFIKNMDFSSKTRSILSRFPDFYQADGGGFFLLEFLQIFGQVLEEAEADLLRVMRSHWVDTADNADSRGFDTSQKGDLDKILAFYLENLGGTSQLKQVDWHFVVQDIADLPALLARLSQPREPLSRFLQSRLSAETLELIPTHEQAAGWVTVTRSSAETTLTLPKGSRLLPQNGQVSFETTADVTLKYQVRETAVPIRAATPGSRHEITARRSWQVQSGDPALAGLTIYNERPLQIQTNTLLHLLVSDLNRLLIEPLYNKELFPNLPLSEELQTLVRQNPRTGRALAQLNYGLITAVYSRELIPSYASYRSRLRGVIGILKGGASTVEGIRSLIAINLGIVGDSPAAQAARQKIRLEEFQPQPILTEETGPTGEGLVLRQGFILQNPNPVEVVPDVTIRFHPMLPRPLLAPTLVNLTTGQKTTYTGTVRRRDVLVFRQNGEIWVNGRLVATTQMAELPPGESRWRLEASAGLAEGRFDQTFFNTTAFEQEKRDEQALARLGGGDLDIDQNRFDWPLTRFDEAFFLDGELAIAKIEVVVNKLTPGSFAVRVPWDIPGFTDRFAEFSDHPRHQIRYIIEKVKAAGIYVGIAYEKTFTETHDVTEALQLFGKLYKAEEQPQQEAALTVYGRHTPEQDQGGILHDMDEALTVSGVFDVTHFDHALFWHKSGVFDEARFDYEDFWHENSYFSQARFDQAEFGAVLGLYNYTAYDQADFGPESGLTDRSGFDHAIFEE